MVMQQKANFTGTRRRLKEKGNVMSDGVKLILGSSTHCPHLMPEILELKYDTKFFSS